MLLPNDECVPGKSMDLDDGQGKIIGVEELLDMDKPPRSVYRLKLMVMKWCFSDGGEKKAGFSLSLAVNLDTVPDDKASKGAPTARPRSSRPPNSNAAASGPSRPPATSAHVPRAGHHLYPL